MLTFQALLLYISALTLASAGIFCYAPTEHPLVLDHCLEAVHSSTFLPANRPRRKWTIKGPLGDDFPNYRGLPQTLPRRGISHHCEVNVSLMQPREVGDWTELSVFREAAERLINQCVRGDDGGPPGRSGRIDVGLYKIMVFYY